LIKPRVMRTAFSLVLLATMAFSASVAAEDPIGQVEQALHDNVVAAFDNVSSTISDMEGNVSDVASSAFDTAKSDLEAIETRIGGAIDNVGDAAVREYREIQHGIQGVAGDADGFLHRAGHTLEDAEHDAWGTLQDGYHNVANSIDHVIDGLHS